MCGIAGTIGPEWLMTQNQRRNVINQMCEVIEHRGPDDEGILIKGGVALGLRRLSIIDVKGGQQPISNEDGTIWIVFNGEIYNYRELRRFLNLCGHKFRTNSDTEVIVHLYEELGERCVEKMRGMYSFAIWDGRQEKMLLGRDRLGKKPMHFLHAGDTLIFGSEIKSVLQHPLVQREVNYEAISDYLSFGYIPDPKTAFRGIEKLPPGHTLTFQYGQVTQRCYWDFNYTENEEPVRSEREYIAELRSKIEESVRIRLIGEVPMGAFLSGGIDSSTVVAAMTKLTKAPVKTFSIGFTEASHDELEYARVSAQRFGSDHREFIVSPDVCRLVEEVVWHHDEPFADVSSIPTYAVSKLAHDHVKVALTGDGGDEVFAGYDRYALHQRRARFERLPAAARKHFLLPLSNALPNVTPGKNFLRNIALDPAARYVDSLTMFNRQQKSALLGDRATRWLGKYNSDDSFIKLFNVPSSPLSIDRLMYLDSKTYLPGDIMAKIDRMSMANSIETRTPFLDHELIEFVQRIPGSLKLRGQETKYILKQAVKGIVPEIVINRPKKGFGVPLNQWFKRELKDMLYDTLTDQRTYSRGLLNVNAMRAVMQEHHLGRRDYSRQLWSLLTLELWHRAFIDQKPEMSYEGAKSITLHQLVHAAAG